MKKNNLKALELLILPLVLGFFLFWSLNKSFPIYFLGQLGGAIFFAQCFILMHEFGHRSMFKHNKLNTFIGHLFSVFTFIPYYNWREIHDLHHKWTGYRDKDPTTEKTFANRLTPFQKNLINFCWKYYIPLFTLGYRFGIYWKAEKLYRHLSKKVYRKCLVSMFLYLSVYILLIYYYSSEALNLLPAIILSFNITDIMSLSQHSHIEMKYSKGEDVEPLIYRDQIIYTRSLKFPRFLAKYILFNFNYHEAHHAYPGLPCYHLDQVQVDNKNFYSFLPWLKKVKSMPGVDFVFKSDPNRVGF